MMIGNFSKDNKEFIIKNMRSKRPLCNYLWNEDGVFKCDHFGFGNSFACIVSIRRSMDYGESLVYIKDKFIGEFYNPNRNYTNLPFDNYSALVGLGYHKVSSLYKGVCCDFSITMSTNGYNILFQIK